MQEFDIIADFRALRACSEGITEQACLAPRTVAMRGSHEVATCPLPMPVVPATDPLAYRSPTHAVAHAPVVRPLHDPWRACVVPRERPDHRPFAPEGRKTWIVSVFPSS